MKALQRPGTGNNAVSTNSVRSQSSVTPKKSEPRMSGGTPRQGTPLRRRSNLDSSNVNPRGYSDTPVKRRESGVSNGGTKPQRDVYVPVKGRVGGAPSSQTTPKNIKDTRPCTPDGTSALAQAHGANVTPQSNGKLCSLVSDVISANFLIDTT